MFEATTTIARSKDIVWKYFTNVATWNVWWGGALQKVDPGWETNARLVWASGTPSILSECTPAEKVVISNPTGTKVVFTFVSTEDGASTLVGHSLDYSGSSLSVSNPAVVQARCSSTLAALRKGLEGPARSAADAGTSASATTSKPVGKKKNTPGTIAVTISILLGIVGIIVLIASIGDNVDSPFILWSPCAGSLVFLGIGIFQISRFMKLQRQRALLPPQEPVTVTPPAPAPVDPNTASKP